jgi:hypothetical protein
VVIARAAFGVWGYTVLSKKKGNGDRLAQATSNKEQNGHVLAVFTVTSAFAFPLLPVNKPTRIGGDSTGCKLISILATECFFARCGVLLKKDDIVASRKNGRHV